MLAAICSAYLMFYVESVQSSSVPVGRFCSKTSDCGTDLLYCSSNGVCLCNEERANLVYEFRHHFDIREPKCEDLPCTVLKPVEENECTLHGAVCAPRPHRTYAGICKCPGNKTGVRRPGGLSSEYSDYCKFVVLSKAGESCTSNSHVCDVDRKLRCNDYSCECHYNYIYSFELEICMRRDDYVAKFGASKVGAYGQYCRTYSDCNSDMSCQNNKCVCPYRCADDVEYVKTEDLCYCPFAFQTFLLTAIPVMIVLALFACFIGWVVHVKRRHMFSQQHLPRNYVVTVQNINSQPLVTSYQPTSLRPLPSAPAAQVLEQQPLAAGTQFFVPTSANVSDEPPAYSDLYGPYQMPVKSPKNN